MQKYVRALFSFGLPFVAGAIGSFFTTPAIPTWYADLVKPSFNPPNAAFGPVWTVLYLLMGISLYRVWSVDGDGRTVQSAVRLFLIHLAVNTLWSVLFFGLRSPLLGLVGIVILLVLIILVIRAFWKIDRLAGILLLPYLAWVCLATLLNAAIWQLNP